MEGNKDTTGNILSRLKGDKVVWMILLMMVMTSIICIFSSTSRLLSAGQTRVDLVREQAVIAALGLAVTVGLYNVRNLDWFRKISASGFVISFILAFILILHIRTPFFYASEINGAWRIITIKAGTHQFQMHIFELIKVLMVMYMAWALDAVKNDRLKWPVSKLWQRILYIYAPFTIIMVMVLPGSNSAALFIACILFIVILLGGGKFKELMLLAAAAVVALGICFGIYKISDGKVMGRIGTGISRVFDHTDWEAQALNSKSGSKEFYEAVDEIRQEYSAKIAIHEGGFFGKGPGQSTQRYIVPDMPEDYMFSFILEEYGIWGATIVMLLYVALMARGTLLAKHCYDFFGKLALAGLTLLITLQAFLHIFVNLDIGPMTGQTLPLISHGKFAFLCFCMAFGIILSYSKNIDVDSYETETQSDEVQKD